MQKILATTTILLFFLSGCEIKQSIQPQKEGYSFNGHKISSTELQSSIKEMEMQDQRRSSEMHFHRISEKVPGFGGYYIDGEGNYVMYLKKDSSPDLSRSLAAQEIRNFKRGFDGSNIIIRKADYGFDELAKWRELVSNFVLLNDTFHFVLSTHVNESINRVSIGVNLEEYNDRNISLLKEFIKEELKIPISAIEFEKTSPIKLDRSLNDYDFPLLTGPLGSYNRPLVGGINIVYPNQPGGNYGCTAGFSGVLNGKKVVITNSHCTDDIWNLSANLPFYQNIVDVGFSIGTEYKDPNPSSCGFLSFYKCRKSDAAAIEVLPSEDIGLGLIARTTGNSWDQTPGSVDINNSNKIFSIVASSADENLTVGQIVHKMGRNTGWTSGQVAVTCIDVVGFTKPFWKLECQMAATYYSDGGDSGAPVFSIVTTSQEHKPVFLYGIHFGRNIHGNDLAYFSPMGGIRHDLGDIEARDPNFEFDPPPGGGGPGPDPEPCEPPGPCQ